MCQNDVDRGEGERDLEQSVECSATLRRLLHTECSIPDWEWQCRASIEEQLNLRLAWACAYRWSNIVVHCNRSFVRYHQHPFILARYLISFVIKELSMNSLLLLVTCGCGFFPSQSLVIIHCPPSQSCDGGEKYLFRYLRSPLKASLCR